MSQLAELDLSAQLYLGFLVLLYGERLVELVVSGRNTRRALAAGAVETGRGHFRMMALFHAFFPALCGLEVLVLARPFPGLLGWIALAVAVLAQALRWWSVTTLGPAWTVQVVTAPDHEPVTTGPYRFVRHPNYVAVILEIAAVPLIHGAWVMAIVGTVVNAALLRVRIPVEEAALGSSHAAAFADRPRLIPGVRRGGD